MDKIRNDDIREKLNIGSCRKYIRRPSYGGVAYEKSTLRNADESSGMASKVWKTFEKVRKVDGRKCKFWIQTLDSSHIEVVEKLMFKYYINEEPLSKYNKAVEDEVTILEATQYYKYIMTLGLSFVCMTNDDNGIPKIVGFSLNSIESRNRPKTEEVACRGKNLKVACGIFTSKFSQKVAVKAGYTELTSKSYKEMRNIKPHLVPDGIEEHTEDLKIFYCEI
ncbi:hypothetical protein FQA39_LY18505 [Lamprigera yunnana]|nr:hypothetical protein FQA39_LY18505 [Lamprigera yunnana]